MPAELTPADYQVLESLSRTVQTMLRDLGQRFWGAPRDSVRAFQRQWNSRESVIKRVLVSSGLAASAYETLVVDGRFGRRTSRAAAMFVPREGLPLARTAPDVPAWYAQHKDVVDQMGAPQSPSEPIPEEPETPPDYVDDAQRDVDRAQDQQTVEDIVDTTVDEPPPEPEPEPEPREPRQRKRQVPEPEFSVTTSAKESDTQWVWAAVAAAGILSATVGWLVWRRS